MILICVLILREHRREQTEKQSPNTGSPKPQHQMRGSCFHRWCHCRIALSSLRGGVEKWGATEVKVEGKGAGKPRRHRSHICLGGHNQDQDVPGRVLIYQHGWGRYDHARACRQQHVRVLRDTSNNIHAGEDYECRVIFRVSQRHQMGRYETDPD
jgi:hypothetical protein